MSRFDNMLIGRKFTAISCFQKANLFLCVLLMSTLTSFSQDEGVKPPVVSEYKGDTTFANFHTLRFDIAKAQIVSLKKNGALLVRLKTNANTINRLKSAGNNDLATQVERETAIKNKIIILSYLQEFKFCPVYFFTSDYSDSVKHKNISGIFLDSNLVINPNIVCTASFYVIADNRSAICNSSLGVVPESLANSSIERGAPEREVAIVIKNRYFIQLHKPFPYFQIKSSSQSFYNGKQTMTSIKLDALYEQLPKLKVGVFETKDLKKFKGCVFLLNLAFEEFYKSAETFSIPNEVKQFVY